MRDFGAIPIWSDFGKPKKSNTNKAALAGGILPGLPHLNKAGQVVPPPGFGPKPPKRAKHAKQSKHGTHP